MSRLKGPQNEHPNTYFVQDRSSGEEMARLELQDKMLTIGLGGVLPEQADPASLRRVLDVGCGTGGWLMETARTYPQIERLVGVDISGKMVAHARAQIEAQHLDGRVQFQVMDALRRLEFSDATFDLVNQRLGVSWLRRWDWLPLFLEYLRVTRAGGIVRVSEGDAIIESNSPALSRICAIALSASYHAGRLFAPKWDGLTGELERLMKGHAIEEVQSQVHTLVYQAGTEMGQAFRRDMAALFRVGLPFLQKWSNVPDNYAQICEQALKEMRQPEFVARWTFRVAWGVRPRDGQPILRRGLL